MQITADEIKDKYFKKHIADLKEYGEVSILTWKEPGTNFYAIRYVFDGRNVYITGDMGEAIFSLTWTASVESFTKVSPGYFHEKLGCFCDETYSFDVDEAIEELDEHFAEYDEENMYTELLNEMKAKVKSCDTQREWAECVNESSLNDKLRDFDSDYWEWAYEVGQVIPSRVIFYLVGLQMAAEQLKKQS